MAVLEANHQHDNRNDGIDNGEFNPSLLRIAQHGNQREGNGRDNHIADGGHAGTEQIDNGTLIGITRHQRCQCCIRQIQCGVYNGCAEVIGNEHIDALDDRRSRRNRKQQNRRDAVWNHHP